MVFWILSAEATAHYETAYRLRKVCRLAIRPLATIAFPVCAVLFAQQQWTAARDYGVKIVLTAAALGFAMLPIGLIDPQRVMVPGARPMPARVGFCGSSS